MIDYRTIQQNLSANCYVDRGLTIINADKCYLYGNNGKKYLDMMSNYGVNLLGYNYDKINNALIDQIKKITTLHNSFNNDTRAIALQKLIDFCQHGLQQAFLSNSGAEAIETALKFAVLHTRKKKFIALNNSYHGKTFGALSATHNPKYRKDFAPLLWEFCHISANDITELENTIDDQTAAIVIELVQGEGGIIPLDKTYVSKLVEICKQKNVLIIVDEIQTGIGRTGTKLAIDQYNLDPDILTLGKGLAGGVPVGATLITNTIAQSITKGIHSSTFGGNPLACAGIIATLESIDDTLLTNVVTNSSYLIKELQCIKSDVITDIRYLGLMIGIEVKTKRDNILQILQKLGILAIPAGENVVRLLPPLIITKDDIDQFIKSFKSTINFLNKA
jgi:LysW-gamma-L-lysine/LysW-L-ornithine aminotransferase